MGPVSPAAHAVAAAVVAIPLLATSQPACWALAPPLAVAAAGWAWSRARPAEPAILPLGLLLLLSAFRAGASGVPGAALQETLGRAAAAAVFVGVAATSAAERGVVAGGLLLVVGLETLVALVVPPHPDYPGARYGTFENPNLLGGVSAVAVPVALSAARARAGRARGAAVAALALAVLSIALSRSRAAAVAAGVGAALVAAPAAAPAAIGVVAAVAVGTPLLATGLEIPLERLEVWRPAVALAGARPLEGWGVGRGVFEAVSALSTPPDAPVWGHAHNLPLQVAVETGIVGLALGLWIVLALLGAGAGGAAGVAGRAALAAALVHAAADFVAWSPGASVPIAAAVGLAARPPDEAARRALPEPARLAAAAAALALAAAPSFLLGTAIAARGAWWPAATPFVERAAQASAAGDVAAARAALREATARAPASGAPREALGDLELQAGRPRAAHAAYRAAFRRRVRPDLALRIGEARDMAGAAGGAEGWYRLAAVLSHPLP